MTIQQGDKTDTKTLTASYKRLSGIEHVKRGFELGYKKAFVNN